ncbi:MAG: M1 family metallopeptidase, partial [Anaerolineales bacterium]
PTLTPVPPTPLPTETPTSPPSPTPDATMTPSTGPTLPAALPPGPRPQYLLFAQLDYARKRVDVDYLAAYPNQTGQPLDTLVLAVEPNLYANGFILLAITYNGQAVPYRINGNRLEVPLPAPLPAGETASLGMTYRLWLPQKGGGQVYGYNNAQINLVNWIPQFVPYQPGAGWLIYAPWPFGEHLSFDSADFEINLRVTDPALGVQVAASAPAQPNGDWMRYRLEAARMFALSASPLFISESRQVYGITVTSTCFSGREAAGRAMLGYAEQAITLYANLFGPYPYPSLSIVETHLNDGMEYDGLIFLSGSFYAEYNGTARSNLAMIGVHEIAHQWWYGAVGNNQAQEPWLDEALATYAERIFYERTYPADLAWWWNFRINFFAPTGYVDTTIFNGGNFRQYTNAVYLNGANFLEELRGQIGDDAFFAFLKDYTTQMSGRRTTQADFFRILAEHSRADISNLTRRYFQNPP